MERSHPCSKQSVPEPSVPEPSVPEPSVPEPSVPEPSVPEPSVPEPSVSEPSSFLKYLVPEPSFIPEFSIKCSESAYKAFMGLFTRIMDVMPHFKPISVVKLSEFVFNKLFDGVNLPYAVIEYLHLALFGVFPSSRNVSDEISIFFPYSISAIISGYT